MKYDPGPVEMEGAQMKGANLSSAKMSGAMAHHTDFTDAIMVGCNLVRANLANANLTNANLSGADLSGASLKGAALTNAVLTGATLTQTDMSGANTAGMLGDKPAGKPLDELGMPPEEALRQHGLWVTSGGAQGKLADFSGFDLRQIGSQQGGLLRAQHGRRAAAGGQADR